MRQAKHYPVSAQMRLGARVLVRFIGGQCPLHGPICVSTAAVRNIGLPGFIAGPECAVARRDRKLAEHGGVFRARARRCSAGSCACAGKLSGLRARRCSSPTVLSAPGFDPGEREGVRMGASPLVLRPRASDKVRKDRGRRPSISVCLYAPGRDSIGAASIVGQWRRSSRSNATVMRTSCGSTGRFQVSSQPPPRRK